MRYSCRAVVGHGQVCEPNYQCDACAAKQKYMPRIKKLEAALREIDQTSDSFTSMSYAMFTQTVRNIARKALEGKDE